MNRATQIGGTLLLIVAVGLTVAAGSRFSSVQNGASYEVPPLRMLRHELRNANQANVIFENAGSVKTTVLVKVYADIDNASNVDVRLGANTPRLSIRKGDGETAIFEVPPGSSVQAISSNTALFFHDVEVVR